MTFKHKLSRRLALLRDADRHGEARRSGAPAAGLPGQSAAGGQDHGFPGPASAGAAFRVIASRSPTTATTHNLLRQGKELT